MLTTEKVTGWDFVWPNAAILMLHFFSYTTTGIVLVIAVLYSQNIEPFIWVTVVRQVIIYPNHAMETKDTAL